MLVKGTIVFLSHYSDLYGANLSLLTLTKELKKLGCSVAVICPSKGPFVGLLREAEIPVYPLNIQSETYQPTGLSIAKGLQRYLRNQLLLPRLIRLLKELNASILHTNTLVLQIGAKAAKKLNIPHVWHVREILPQQYNLKFITGWLSQQKLLNKAAAVIAISKAVQQHMLQQLTTKVVVLYNGILEEQKYIKPPVRNANKPLVALLAGVLVESKGQHQAIAAVAQAVAEGANIELWLAGDAPQASYQRQLKQQAAAAGIAERVKFLGYRTDIDQLLAQAHVGLMCGQGEALGRVTIEALQAGLPVIGLRSGATPELVQPNHNGLLFSTTDELAQHLLTLEKEEEKRFLLGQTAQTELYERFGAAPYAAEVLQLYTAILKDFNG